MSYEPTALLLWDPATQGDAPRADNEPARPARIKDAGRVWDHGLLVGEVLGVEVEPAQAAIDAVYHLPDDLPRLFLEDAIELLRDTFCEIGHRLASALQDGRPIGSGGDRLVRSAHIVAGPEGRLQVRGTRFPLDLLTVRLRELCAMLTFANSHGLLVVERDEDAV